jgi:hypothetical protein
MKVSEQIDLLNLEVRNLKHEVTRLKNMLYMQKLPELIKRPGPRASTIVLKRNIAITVEVVAGSTYKEAGKRYHITAGCVRDIVYRILNRYVIHKLPGRNLVPTRIQSFRDNMHSVNSILINLDKELNK